MQTARRAFPTFDDTSSLIPTTTHPLGDAPSVRMPANVVPSVPIGAALGHRRRLHQLFLWFVDDGGISQPVGAFSRYGTLNPLP